MKKLIILLPLLIGCGSSGSENSTTNECSLAFTNDPNVALEIAETAEDLGAEIIPSEFPNNQIGVDSGPIEIFFCSDVINLDDNTVTIDGTLDLARRGELTFVEINQ